jgi:hypothetical protein
MRHNVRFQARRKGERGRADAVRRRLQTLVRWRIVGLAKAILRSGNRCPSLDVEVPYSLCLAKKRARPSATALGFIYWSAWVACGTTSSSACGIHCLTSAWLSWNIGAVSVPTTDRMG